VDTPELYLRLPVKSSCVPDHVRDGSSVLVSLRSGRRLGGCQLRHLLGQRPCELSQHHLVRYMLSQLPGRAYAADAVLGHQPGNGTVEFVDNPWTVVSFSRHHDVDLLHVLITF
jgi:hypothetical protein